METKASAKALEFGADMAKRMLDGRRSHAGMVRPGSRNLTEAKLAAVCAVAFQNGMDHAVPGGGDAALDRAVEAEAARKAPAGVEREVYVAVRVDISAGVAGGRIAEAHVDCEGAPWAHCAPATFDPETEEWIDSSDEDAAAVSAFIDARLK